MNHHVLEEIITVDEAACTTRSVSVCAVRREVDVLIDELTATGLARVLEVLLSIEADRYVARSNECRDPDQRRALVTRNGFARERRVPMGRVSVTITPPRVNDRRIVDGVRKKFASSILAPGRAPSVGGVYRLTAAFLRGWASGDFSGVGEHLLGCAFAGGAEVVSALTDLRHQRLSEPLADLRFARVLADAVVCTPVLELDPKDALVLVGIMPSGRLHLIDMSLGDPSSQESWAALVAKARARGLSAATPLSFNSS